MPLGFEMPGIEVSEPAVPSPDLQRPLFRSHKALRRRRDVGPYVEALRIYSDQDAISANGTAIATAPSLPLTPPVFNEDDNQSTESELPGSESVKSDRTILPFTPTRSQRLLTPDVTPPRNPSINRTDTNQLPQLLSSSRTGSFQTACENITSDAETENSFLSTRSLQRSRQSAQTQKLIENGHQTSSPNSGNPSTPRDRSNASDRSAFGSYRSQSMNARKENADGLVVTPTRRSPLLNGVQNDVRGTDISAPSVKDDRDLQDTPVRGRSLRDRVNDSQNHMSSPSVEQFGENIGWPSVGDSSNPTEAPESRRLSGVSTASTVEAIIIDSPRPAKRALRHTEKRLSLRSASSPITRSERTSIASNPDSQHRLIHKAARITEKDRRSIASDKSISATSTLGAAQSNIEVVPVIVIPERRSSLQSSNANSRNQSRSCSRGSSQRTTLASKSRAGSHDHPRRKNRTVSDSAPRVSQDSNARGRSFSRPPVIPPRRSSLSAPTSKNNSRATSLTSESLRHHTLAMEPDVQKPEPKPDVHEFPAASSDHSHDNHEAPNGHLSVGVDGMSSLRTPSLPFTQSSVHSLSPGPIEINEATTVSFFPHNNRSLLLVNQNVLPESRAVQAVRGNYRGMLDDPRTPQGSSQALQAVIDSPLRNPRPPPKPPIWKVLPPTPTEEMDRQIRGPGDSESSNGGLVRRLGSVRRALSARQRSNSSNSVKRSFPTSAKRPKDVTDIDSRLHSFWRPRRFWDDSAEVSPEKEEPLVERSPEKNEIISNSVGMPQQQIIFEGPRLARRNPETRMFIDGTIRHYPSRDKLMESRVLSPDILRRGSPLHQRRFRSIRWLKLRFRPARLRNIRKRMRRSRQRREVQKWHARRENLKQSIGDVVHVDSST